MEHISQILPAVVDLIIKEFGSEAKEKEDQDSIHPRPDALCEPEPITE